MKPTVALIYGGEGAEHDISLLSAENVCKFIDRSSYDILKVVIDRSGEWYIESEGGRTHAFPVFWNEKGGLFTQGKTFPVDVAVPLLHGDLGEDGIITGALRAAHIKFVGCETASGAVCSDKITTKLVAEALGIPTAKWTFSDSDDTSLAVKKAEENLSYPMFVKPVSLGSSIGISKVYFKDELREAYEAAHKLSKRVLIEEGISVKCELECAYLAFSGKEYFEVGSVFSNGEFYDFEKKYKTATKTDTNASNEAVKAKVIDAAKKLREAIGIRHISRFDFFFAEDGRVLFNEINTLPGMTKTSLYPALTQKMGLSEGEFINRLISEALL